MATASRKKEQKRKDRHRSRPPGMDGFHQFRSKQDGEADGGSPRPPPRVLVERSRNRNADRSQQDLDWEGQRRRGEDRRFGEVDHRVPPTATTVCTIYDLDGRRRKGNDWDEFEALDAVKFPKIYPFTLFSLSIIKFDCSGRFRNGTRTDFGWSMGRGDGEFVAQSTTTESKSSSRAPATRNSIVARPSSSGRAENWISSS